MTARRMWALLRWSWTTRARLLASLRRWREAAGTDVQARSVCCGGGDVQAVLGTATAVQAATADGRDEGAAPVVATSRAAGAKAVGWWDDGPEMTDNRHTDSTVLMESGTDVEDQDISRGDV